jgi:hypothetical protein
VDIFQMSKAGYAHLRDVHSPCPGRTGSVGANYMRPPFDSALLAAVGRQYSIRLWAGQEITRPTSLRCTSMTTGCLKAGKDASGSQR